VGEDSLLAVYIGLCWDKMEGLLSPTLSQTEDYYGILGCHPGATDQQILAEYRVKAKEVHPDKVGVQADPEDFQAIQEAKETLLDSAKRRLYDKWRSAGLSIPFKQWMGLAASVRSTVHWAVPNTQERMLPEGQENKDEKSEGAPQESSLHKEPSLNRQDSVCSQLGTFVVVDQLDQEILRRKFRNYQI